MSTGEDETRRVDVRGVAIARALRPERAPGVETERVRTAARSRLFARKADPVIVDRYFIVDLVGRGGMGVVYTAYDPTLDRKVALKVLSPETSGDGTPEDEDQSEALIREARALARVTHPNVVPVHDAGRVGDRVYLTMELIEGETLRSWLGDGEPRPWREALDVLVQAGRGLEAAHTAGLVHRDFKPDNVIIGADGVARVVDFGLARALETPSTDGGTTTVDGSPQTRGAGTRGYMAPERLGGAPADVRSDLFAFCVTAFEALTGRRPPRPETEEDGKPDDDPRWPAAVPPWLTRAIDMGLALDPKRRPESMSTLLTDLEEGQRAQEREQRRRVARRRRIVSVSMGLAVLAAGGLGTRAWWAARAERCTGAREKLVDVWDDTTKARVREAMLGTGVAYAEKAWANTSASLDAHVSAWADMRHDACAATTLRGEQSPEVMDLRMACLDRAHVALRAATETLADADAEVVEHAHQVVGSLADIARCADVAALQAAVEPPPAAEAEAVDSTRGWIARAEAENVAGRYEAAQDYVRKAEEAFGDAAYVPARIELLLEKGAVLAQRGQFESSREAREEALHLAMEAGAVQAMQRAASELLYVVGYRLARPVEAAPYRLMALELPVSGSAKANAVHHLAAALEAEGKYAEAEAEHRRALALWEEAVGPEHVYVTVARNGLANVLTAEGKFEEAAAEHRAALAQWERTVGVEHPLVIESSNNLAVVLHAQRKYAEAEEEFRRLLTLRMKVLGPKHPDVAVSRQNLAGTLLQQGRFEEAERQLREAIALLEQTLGPEHRHTAGSRLNLAMALREQGKVAEAEAELRRVAALFERVLGADHPHVAVARTELAWVLLDRDRAAEAAEIAELAWAQRRRPDVPAERRGSTAFVLARALWDSGPDAGRRKRARDLAEQALKAYVEAGDAHQERITQIEGWIAKHRP